MFGIMTAAGAAEVERVYISTDKDAYIAGERIWCSVFCTDAGHSLSPMSATAYIELQSENGIVGTAKAALYGGRGAAELQIPADLATGNYRLIGYTAANRSENGYDWHEYAKIVSVFNVLTSDRVEKGVEIVEDNEYKRAAGVSSRTIRLDSDGRIVWTGPEGEAADVSISICVEDGIVPAGSCDIRDFTAGRIPASVTYSDGCIPEFEGEIIHCTVSGGNDGRAAFIATPSAVPDFCTSFVKDGKADFFTQNFFGDTDIVCQVEKSAPGSKIEIISPFAGVTGGNIPALKMSRSISNAIIERSRVLKENRKAGVDTLWSYMPDRSRYLMGQAPIQYKLDNYTRFPVMDEVIIEFITELRVRKDENGNQDVQVKLSDDYGKFYFSSGQSLMMVDGVPVLNHKAISDYDPLLVESVNIYPYSFFAGDRSFTGAANFVTYKKTFPDVKFDEDVRIMSFRGTSYPASYSGSANTLYWHPLVKVAAGSGTTVECAIPQGVRQIRVRIEGLTESGKPVLETAVLTK